MLLALRQAKFLRLPLLLLFGSTGAAQSHLSLPAPSASPIEPTPREAPYRRIDNEEGAWIDLALAPVRPLAVDLANDRIFALHVHGSRLIEAQLDGTFLRSLDLPWGPVSVATAGSDFVLVACRGSHTLVRVDLSQGRIDRILALPSEPGDLVVHPTTGYAWVSCSGADRVVEVDVDAGQILREVLLPAKHPTFLALVGSEVHVAPMFSGNNSTVQTGEHRVNAGPDGILDLENASVAQQGLRDHDLFRIDGGTAVPSATDMGTVLFALGVNPATGELWQLGTEALNKDPERFGEAAIRGTFARNQLAITTLASGSVVAPGRIVDLDDSDPLLPGVQVDPERTVGQPYALDFDGAGNAYVVGLLSNNVMMLAASGTLRREWDVASIPRAVRVDTAGERAWVYSQGTSTVELYDLTPLAPTRVAVLDLGPDPTPELEARGRRLFFDGSHSRDGNLSCSTCHIEGGSDLMAWDLSALPVDDKGPLTTQTLIGIDDMARFHWRGERSELIDFNSAFDELLGGDPLSVDEFEAFAAYLRSLRHPANPEQHPRRVVDATTGFTTPDGVFHPGDAVVGQDSYYELAPPGGNTCQHCHPLPTGASGDIFVDESGFEFPRRNHFDVPGLQGLWRKRQSTLEEVVFADGSVETRPTLGTAFSSTGLMDDVFELLSNKDDITAFVVQLDSGIAPAVHHASLLGPGADSGGVQRTYLLPQARARNCDIAVFGTVDLGRGSLPLRWYWDRTQDRFVSEDSGLGSVDLDFFVDQAAQGERNVFVGLPVGMGRGFAVDRDRDELFNLDELALGTGPWNGDSDGDGDPDGHEVTESGDPLDPDVTSDDQTPATLGALELVHVNSSSAKLRLETSEPTRLVTTWNAGPSSGQVDGTRFETLHEIVLRELSVGEHHQISVTAYDLGGNTSATALAGGLTTQDYLMPELPVLEDLTSVVIGDANGILRLQVQARMEFKGGGAIAGRRLDLRLFVNGEAAGALQGTLSSTDGVSGAVVVATNLSPGDEVKVGVFGIHDDLTGSVALWDMASTAPENRELMRVYTGNG